MYHIGTLANHTLTTPDTFLARRVINSQNFLDFGGPYHAHFLFMKMSKWDDKFSS